MLGGDFWCVAARCDGENCFKFQDPVFWKFQGHYMGPNLSAPLNPIQLRGMI